MTKLTQKEKRQIADKLYELIGSGHYVKIKGKRRDCGNGRCFIGLIQEAVVQLGYGEWVSKDDEGIDDVTYDVKCSLTAPGGITMLMNRGGYEGSAVGLETDGLERINDKKDLSFKEMYKIFVEKNNL